MLLMEEMYKQGVVKPICLDVYYSTRQPKYNWVNYVGIAVSFSYIMHVFKKWPNLGKYKCEVAD